MATFRYTITAEDAGTEIQHFLRFRQGISRKVVISLKHLPEGILRNGIHARTIDLLQEGDLLQITLPESSRRLPPCEADVPRLYWDNDVAVFNKPAGMPVHQSGGHIFGTLASVYATLCEKEGAPGTFRAVNRIDKDTTGAVVVARHQIAAGKLWKGVAKRYVAIVSGVPTPAGGLIDLPLEREIPLEMKRIVSPDGERAVTEYRVLAAAADGSCALVGFFPAYRPHPPDPGAYGGKGLAAAGRRVVRRPHRLLPPAGAALRRGRLHSPHYRAAAVPYRSPAAGYGRPAGAKGHRLAARACPVCRGAADGAAHHRGADHRALPQA